MPQLPSPKQAKLFLNKAQNILEIFLAIVIFSIAFISLITLANNYLNALKVSRERIIANLLAQEGLELVIAKRNVDQSNFNLVDGTYCADYNNLSFQSQPQACSLYINNEGFYNHTSGTSTIFKRLIHISSTSTNGKEIYFVTSTVQVENGPIVELTTILTSWPF